MRPLTVFIADDERPAREFLKRMLERADDVEVVGEAADGEAAVEGIRSLQPDLALLDLQMPGVTGLEAVRALAPEETPLIAFVTAYDQFAVDAFELNAVDYLLKPVEAGRLSETIDRARARRGDPEWRDREAGRIAAAYSEIETRGEPLERIPVRDRDEILLIPVSDVAAIAADGELLIISTEGGGRYTINYRLKDIETRLDPRRWVRASRSALINLDHLAGAAPMPGGTYLLRMKNGMEIPASRTRSKELRAFVLNL